MTQQHKRTKGKYLKMSTDKQDVTRAYNGIIGKYVKYKRAINHNNTACLTKADSSENGILSTNKLSRSMYGDEVNKRVTQEAYS